MTDEVNDWINNWKKILNKKPDNEKKYFHYVIPKLFCKDGFNVSIQASSGHYCSPRHEEKLMAFDYDDSDIIHTEFELGFPSEKEELILEYAEEKNKPTGTVYGWVPLAIILQLIEKHEGIDYHKSLSDYAKNIQKR